MTGLRELEWPNAPSEISLMISKSGIKLKNPIVSSMFYDAWFEFFYIILNACLVEDWDGCL